MELWSLAKEAYFASLCRLTVLGAAATHVVQRGIRYHP
jgi:hypothetical protein